MYGVGGVLVFALSSMKVRGKSWYCRSACADADDADDDGDDDDDCTFGGVPFMTRRAYTNDCDQSMSVVHLLRTAYHHSANRTNTIQHMQTQP